MADIATLMLADHRRIQRLEASLRKAGQRGGTGPSRTLRSTWPHLAAIIQEHLRSAETICWPAISRTGPRGQAQVRQMKAAATQIRAAIATAQAQPLGSPGWWRAARHVLMSCADHLDEEQRALLTHFGQYGDLPLRDQLGRQWLTSRNHRNLAAAGPARPSAPSPSD